MDAGCLLPARRSHLASEARGSDLEEPPRARGQGQRLGEATRGVVAAQAQEDLEELSHVEGQERWRKEIPLVQGKEQWLCFAAAAVKRYHMPR